MNIILHVANIINLLLPVRETLGLRRILVRMGGIEIGKGTRVTHGVKMYDRYMSIGQFVWIGMNTVLSSSVNGKITIGDNVDIAPGCLIVTGTHEIGASARRAGAGTGQDIVVGSGTWVGARACILAGAEIGSGSVVAAGSVVCAGTYPRNALLAGVPAQVKRVLNED